MRRKQSPTVDDLDQLPFDRATKFAWLRRLRLIADDGSARKLVKVVRLLEAIIALSANDPEGRTAAHVQTIADHLRVSLRTARYAIADAKELNLLIETERKTGHGQLTSLRAINWHAVQSLLRKQQRSQGATLAAQGATTAAQGATTAAQGATTAHPECKDCTRIKEDPKSIPNPNPKPIPTARANVSRGQTGVLGFEDLAVASPPLGEPRHPLDAQRASWQQGTGKAAGLGWWSRPLTAEQIAKHTEIARLWTETVAADVLPETDHYRMCFFALCASLTRRSRSGSVANPAGALTSVLAAIRRARIEKAPEKWPFSAEDEARAKRALATLDGAPVSTRSANLDRELGGSTEIETTRTAAIAALAARFGRHVVDRS